MNININIEVKPEPVEIVFIIDKSGSMSSLARDVIGGFNAFIDSQKALGDDAILSIVQFDDRVSTTMAAKPLHAVSHLTARDYHPEGYTALNDAIGIAISDLEKRNPRRAIIPVMTDGEENRSRHYTHAAAKRKIEDAEARGWQVLYLGANQDAFAVGESYGSVRNHNFAASGEGVKSAMASVDSATRSYRGCP